MTFEEFRKEYSGFDWGNGEIVFIFKDNAIIWNEKNSLHRAIAQNVMVVVLHKNERKDKK